MTGFACGIVGVALLNQVLRSDFQWVGLGANLIFLSSFFCETTYSIIGKKIMSAPSGAQIGPIKVLALALAAGTLANLLIDGPTTFAASSRMPAKGWLLIVGTALICTTIGYSVWYLVIREGEVNVASLTIFAQPVFGIILAKFWLGENLHWGQFWGSAAIVAGLVIGLSRQIKKTPVLTGT